MRVSFVRGFTADRWQLYGFVPPWYNIGFKSFFWLLSVSVSDSGPVQIPKGKVIGKRWRVLKKLGEGGCGSVYKVEDVNTKQEVRYSCIKLYIEQMLVISDWTILQERKVMGYLCANGSGHDHKSILPPLKTRKSLLRHLHWAGQSSSTLPTGLSQYKACGLIDVLPRPARYRAVGLPGNLLIPLRKCSFVHKIAL